MSLQTPNAHDIKTIDDLEDAIDAAHIDVETLILAYRDLIRDLVNACRFDNLSAPDLQRVVQYLDAVPEEAPAQGARSPTRLALWSFAKENQENAVLYHLIRGLICMFGDKADWEVAQDPVIFYFLLYLQRAIDDIEQVFVEHFAKALFGKQ